MNYSEKLAYMETASVFAKLSKAKRAQVGALAVRDRKILSVGINGTLAGTDNTCEDENGNTRCDVLHAEINLIAKLANSTESSKDCTVFITLSPCMSCAILMAASGVKEVYYREEYRDRSGIDWLNNNGVRCSILEK